MHSPLNTDVPGSPLTIYEPMCMNVELTLPYPNT